MVLFFLFISFWPDTKALASGYTQNDWGFNMGYVSNMD